MENGKKIKSFFSKSSEKKRINKIRNGFDMPKIWSRMLVLFTFAIAIIFVFSSYLLFQISGGEIFLIEQEASISVETINRTLMQETIDLFDTKARDFDSLKSTGRSRVIDPSL